MNIYKKYCPNVYVAQCDNQHSKGDLIVIQTRHGKEIENEIHNFLGETKDGKYLYSVTRTDGTNSQTRALSKADKLNGYASNAEKRSSDYYQASKEGADFLALGEPIKIGHHSEGRHRRLIDRNWNRMGKSIEESRKAEEYERRAEYWKSQAKKINLSMPESIDYFHHKLEEAKKEHAFLKDNPTERPHSMSLQYASKYVREVEKSLEIAQKLWG